MESFRSKQQNTPWHSLPLAEVVQQTWGDLNGLTEQEAAKRLAAFGPNRLTPPKKRSVLTRFFLQFHNVLIYVLLLAGIITAALRHWVDAGVILGVVVVNALIGFLQEGKAEKALEALRDILSQQGMVLRDGHKRLTPAEQLTIGDVVFLQPGDKVPADLRLITVKELRIEEAALTGESAPVGKDAAPVAESAGLGDRRCMAFSGTLVTYGQGKGIVVAIGDQTELGRISQLLATVKTLTTRLLLQMADFGRKLTGAILVLAVVTAVFGVLVRNSAIADMFLAAVGLAVAAIPEGLPAIVTITLAIGVQRMAHRNAIIRLLPAVETLGAVTVICSDKTGTLTKNEMTVQAVATADFFLEIGGSGYDPHGGFAVNGNEVSATNFPAVMELCRAGARCNDAEMKHTASGWQLQGDPTEGALLVLALKAGLDLRHEAESFPRTDVIPFESEHRFMATLHHDHAGHGFIYVKGAPERILTMCNRQRRAGEDLPLDVAYWHEQLAEIAGKGQRVLAVAFKSTSNDHQELRYADVEGGLTMLGLYGIIDPPRPDAVAAVAQCVSAGIRVKMITGDHAVTARAIAAQIGMDTDGGVLTGEELHAMDDDQLSLAVRKVAVFARVNPEHKLRLVEVLQANGEVVVMTGDGVNDAPALKRADVGVAMGVKGTEVAKEAAEMVLADDNFSSIVHAVREGRTVYDNIRKAITFILPTNGGEAGIIIAAILSGRLLPITPVQILWVNMITAVTLALALAFEPAEEGIMQRSPRDPREPILSFFLVWRVLFVSLVLVIGTFGLFLWEREQGMPIEQARTVAVNTLVMFEVFYLFSTRSLKTPILQGNGFFGNPTVFLAVGAVLTAQLLYTYLPMMRNLFGSAAITAGDWLRIILVSLPIILLVELEKALVSYWEKKAAMPARPTSSTHKQDEP